ncbi:SPOR domain-containing protein [Gracilimonas sp.]|uniref:SPOR domain-containing protein n=1 Tax=Gracilimonas sp. TaxID=1974203 RepID=UPI0028729333|nr:SPOR domain-containing protein [Gracilimonas sp.]
MMRLIAVFLLCFSISMGACSTSEPTVSETETTEEKDEATSNDISNNTSSSTELERYRTQLSDAYAYRENQIPEAFNRIKVQQEEEENLYEGYRVQIFSGTNVAGADTMAANFRAWADTTIVSYQPETYVFFRTPYYRVHVGDFHERDRAIKFSNIVKRYFRGAWVVYDRVDPFKVPADTTVIQSK